MPVYETLKFDVANGFTLASLEPFEIDTLTPTSGSAPAVAVVDVAAYLTEGRPFSECNEITAVNGAISQTSRITLKDGTSLSSNPGQALLQLLDESLVNSLPGLSGTLLVCGSNRYMKAINGPTLGWWQVSVLIGLLLTAGVWALRRGAQVA